MLILQPEIISWSESRLCGFCPALNAPLQGQGEFGPGPIRGALARLSGASGGLLVGVAIRSMVNGRIWLYGTEKPLQEPGEVDQAFYQATVFGESLGFLFDDDLFRFQGVDLTAQAHWDGLLLSGQLPPLSEGLGGGPELSPLLAGSAEFISLAGNPALSSVSSSDPLLTKFRMPLEPVASCRALSAEDVRSAISSKVGLSSGPLARPSSGGGDLGSSVPFI